MFGTFNFNNASHIENKKSNNYIMKNNKKRLFYYAN